MKFLELCLYIEFEQSSILNSFLIICVYIIIIKKWQKHVVHVILMLSHMVQILSVRPNFYSFN